MITDYAISAAAGALVAVHRRIDRRAGSKSFLWLDRDGRPGLDGLPSDTLPLYGAELVAGYDRARPILVTEGEKVADAVRATGSQAVGTVCGAPLVPDDDVLAVLHGRDVILAPDHDDAGLAQMSGVAARLAGIAGSLRWLDPTGWPAKGDLADILAPGWSAHELHAHAGSGRRLAVDPAVWADVKARLGPVPDGGHGRTDEGRTGTEASDGGHGGTDEHDGGTSGSAHTPPPSAESRRRGLGRRLRQRHRAARRAASRGVPQTIRRVRCGRGRRQHPRLAREPAHHRVGRDRRALRSRRLARLERVGDLPRSVRPARRGHR